MDGTQRYQCLEGASQEDVSEGPIGRHLGIAELITQGLLLIPTKSSFNSATGVRRSFLSWCDIPAIRSGLR